MNVLANLRLLANLLDPRCRMITFRQLVSILQLGLLMLWARGSNYKFGTQLA